MEISVNSLEEMCDLMCNNRLPRRRYSIMDDDIELFVELIPEGEENAISRQLLTQLCINAGLIRESSKDADRAMRKLLHSARIAHSILTKTGGGYYRPTADEWKQIEKHRQSEKKRALNTLASVSYDAKLYEDYYKNRIQREGD